MPVLSAFVATDLFLHWHPVLLLVCFISSVQWFTSPEATDDFSYSHILLNWWFISPQVCVSFWYKLWFFHSGVCIFHLTKYFVVSHLIHDWAGRCTSFVFSIMVWDFKHMLELILFWFMLSIYVWSGYVCWKVTTKGITSVGQLV